MHLLIRFAIVIVLVVPQVACTLRTSVVDRPAVWTIAILPFTSNNRSVGEKVADALAEKLITSRFRVLGTRELQEMLARQHSSIDKAAMNINEIVGKLEGLDAVVIGTVTQKVAEYGLPFYGNNTTYVSSSTAQVINARNGKRLLTVDYTAHAPYFYYDISTPESVASYIAEAMKKLKPSF